LSGFLSGQGGPPFRWVSDKFIIAEPICRYYPFNMPKLLYYLSRKKQTNNKSMASIDSQPAAGKLDAAITMDVLDDITV